MESLILTIFLSSYLFITFRVFERFKVDTTLAIVVNYLVCSITGYFFDPNVFQLISKDIHQPWFINAAIIGLFFFITFNTVAYVTQKMSITVSSIASKMSFIFPFLSSVFILKTIKELNFGMILGLIMAILAVIMTTYRVSDSKKIEKVDSKLYIIPVLLFVASGFLDSFVNYNNFYLLDIHNQSRFILYIFCFAFLGGSLVIIYRYKFLNIKIELKSIIAGIILGVPNYFSMYFLMTALSDYNNNGAFVYSTYNISIILINTAASYFLFKEQLTKINFIGVIAAVSSLILLSI